MAKKIDINGLDYFKEQENEQIAPVETSSTASKAYKVGERFWFKGKLCICTVDIASGGTITLNTNCKLDVLGDDLTSQSEKIAKGELTQLVKNGNFESSSNWTGTFSSVSVSDNKAVVTVSNASNSQFSQPNFTWTAGHIYLIKFTAKGSKNGEIAFSGTNGEKLLVSLTTSEKVITFMLGAAASPIDSFHFWLARSGWSISDFGVGDTITFSKMMVFDLTAMYGKNNEPAQSDFLNVYSDDFYDYNVPDAYPVRDFHNTSFDAMHNRFSIINRFDKTTVINKKYINAGGALADHNDFTASAYIYIGDLEAFSYSYTFRLSLYTDNFAWVSDPTTQNTRGSVATLTVPATAKYARISFYTTEIDKVQAGVGISLDNYVPFGAFMMPNLVIPSSDNKSKVTVSKANRGDYSSLLQALAETDGDVEVIDGVYDIVAEYQAYYDADFFDDSFDRSVAGDFALGLYITNRKVKFDANTTISFDLTDIDVSYAVGADRRFCLFVLGVNATLDGVIGTTVNNWYAIHDDGAGGDYAANYKNVIKNCVIISENMANKNIIGGGCGRYSETYIDNCYFDNGGATSTYTIRYHNTWNGQAQPKISITNTYVNALIYFGYYGSSTKIGTCTVNNCSMAGAIVLDAVEEQSVENLRVLEWANVIRT